MRYSIEPRTRKYVKGYGFFSFARKYKKQFLDRELYFLKANSKKVVQKTGESLENKVADSVTKSNYDKTVRQESIKK